MTTKEKQLIAKQKEQQDQEKELFDLEQKLDIAFKDRYYHSCPPNEDKNSKAEEPEGVTAGKVDRKHFVAENMERLEIIFLWAIEHGVQFCGKETAVIQSAMEEYARSKQINLREELLKFVIHLNTKGGRRSIQAEEISEYLQSKEK